VGEIPQAEIRSARSKAANQRHKPPLCAGTQGTMRVRRAVDLDLGVVFRVIVAISLRGSRRQVPQDVACNREAGCERDMPAPSRHCKGMAGDPSTPRYGGCISMVWHGFDRTGETQAGLVAMEAGQYSGLLMKAGIT
jgi:hypothetical protein